ncbi:MAG: ATP synthase F1 subunit epsilon [Bacteroidota bacterium]
MGVFDLEIVTPDRALFSGKVQSVTVPGSQGSFQILVNHAPIIATLGRGNVKIVGENGDETTLKAQDGVIEVLKNKAIILLERIFED